MEELLAFYPLQYRGIFGCCHLLRSDHFLNLAGFQVDPRSKVPTMRITLEYFCSALVRQQLASQKTSPPFCLQNIPLQSRQMISQAAQATFFGLSY